MLSILYFTYRPGGMDVLLNSLVKLEHANYELIVVDDYANRNLRDKFEDAGVPVGFWGKSKPKQYPDTPFGQINAVNTGLLQCAGDYVVIVEDYTWVPKTFVLDWENAISRHPKNTFISGIGSEWSYKEPEIVDDYSAWHVPFDGDFSKCARLRGWNPSEWEWFNSGSSMENWETLNGLDERMDYWNTLPCEIFPTIVKRAGFKIGVDNKLHVDMIDHRGWMNFDPRMWYINRTSVSHRGDVWFEDPNWYTHAPNSFELSRDRRKIK